MRRKVLALALVMAMLAIGLIPVSIAVADSDAPSFTAQASLVQTSAGTTTFTQIGVDIAGETFAGSVESCEGQQCQHLDGASMSVTQSATLSLA